MQVGFTNRLSGTIFSRSCMSCAMFQIRRAGIIIRRAGIIIRRAGIIIMMRVQTLNLHVMECVSCMYS